MPSVNSLQWMHEIPIVLCYLPAINNLDYILALLRHLHYLLLNPLKLFRGHLRLVPKLRDHLHDHESLLILGTVANLLRLGQKLRFLLLLSTISLSCSCLLLINDLFKDKEVLQEVLLVTINSKDLENTYHLIVAFWDHVMEEWGIVISDEATESVLAEDLMLILNNASDIFFISVPTALKFKVNCATTYLIRVIMNFKILIFRIARGMWSSEMIMIFLGGRLLAATHCRWLWTTARVLSLLFFSLMSNSRNKWLLIGWNIRRRIRDWGCSTTQTSKVHQTDLSHARELTGCIVCWSLWADLSRVVLNIWRGNWVLLDSSRCWMRICAGLTILLRRLFSCPTLVTAKDKQWIGQIIKIFDGQVAIEGRLQVFVVLRMQVS